MTSERNQPSHFPEGSDSYIDNGRGIPIPTEPVWQAPPTRGPRVSETQFPLQQRPAVMPPNPRFTQPQRLQGPYDCGMGSHAPGMTHPLPFGAPNHSASPHMYQPLPDPRQPVPGRSAQRNPVKSLGFASFLVSLGSMLLGLACVVFAIRGAALPGLSCIPLSALGIALGCAGIATEPYARPYATSGTILGTFCLIVASALAILIGILAKLFSMFNESEVASVYVLPVAM